MKIDFIGLEMITFHDLPLKNLSIQLEPFPKVEMNVSEYDEEIEDYIERTIIFKELAHLNPQTLKIEDYKDVEITAFDYRLEGELFVGKIVGLTGFGKPSFEIDLSCRTVEII